MKHVVYIHGFKKMSKKNRLVNKFTATCMMQIGFPPIPADGNCVSSFIAKKANM